MVIFLIEEIWKPIVIEKKGKLFDFTNKYEISNLGRVRNCKRGNILTPNKSRGYLEIRLCKDGKMEAFYVHRLVATAFIDNPNNLPEVNHKDFDKTNNTIENLEWISREDNVKHACNDEYKMKERKQKLSEANKGKNKGKKYTEEHKHKISEAKRGSKNPNATKVLCVETGMVFDCIKDASIWLGIKYTKNGATNIGQCCRGKQKTAYGYHWKYVKEKTN